jgi:hypothetical protein
MDTAEKLRRAVEALEKIATFGHAADCESSAPVHECCCFDKDEKEIAQEALCALSELEP